MDILHGLVVIVVAGAAVIASGLAFFVFYFLVQKIWPILIGGLGGYLIWKDFDDDLGVIFAILLFVVQLWWWKHSKKDLYIPAVDPIADKKKRYNEEMYTPDYFDI